jgi:hypothetical protein
MRARHRLSRFGDRVSGIGAVIQGVHSEPTSNESDSDEGQVIPLGGAVTVLITWIAFRHAAS